MGENTGDPLEQWLTHSGRAALDALTSNVADVLGVLDRQFIIRYVNHTGPGFSRDAIIGQSVYRLVPPGYIEAAHRAFESVFNTGEPAHFETMTSNDEGLRVWTVQVGPIRHEGRVIGAFTVNTDVTAQRQSHVDRDRFFELAHDLMLVVSPTGVMKRVNPAVTDVLGFTAEELLKRSFSEFIHADDRAHTLAYFAAPRPQGVEGRFLRRDGTTRLLAWHCTHDPLTGDVYAVGRDVTDQRDTEARLRHALKMEAVGHLAGGIAHDFNNLLQAVLANAELALTTPGLDAELTEYVSDIEGAARRAAELTGQLLLFSRRQQLRRAPLDLSELVRSVMKLLQRVLPSSIEIELVAGADLSAVDADRAQLEQVIVNLCVNARDAMDGKGRLTIATDELTLDERDCALHTWAVPGRFVRLSVTDTGCGMTAEVRERIFEPFFTTKDPSRGTGLGLATTYGIVQQHGGLVHVYSEVGEGTTFKIYLPADSRAADAVDAVDDLDEPRARPGETLLVVEDDDRVRKPLLGLLEAAGYRTLPASNGREALRVLSTHLAEVDLAVLDLVMPEMGGAAALVHLQSMKPGLPVLFTSGYAQEKYREELPPDAEVLEKPFRTNDLLRRIRDVLDARKR